jgi:hypothetical protein
VWRRGLLALVVLAAAFAGVLLLGFIGENSTVIAFSHPSSEHNAACQLKYHPVAGCSVPSGGTTDPCAIVSGGAISCTINLPDLNAADWANWLGCQFVSDISSFASTIWNSIVGYVGQFIVGIVNNVLGLINGGVDSILNAILSAIVTVEDAFLSAVEAVTNTMIGIADQAGPFGPIVLAVLIAGVGIAAFVFVYFAWFGMIALGKTLFNLL